MTSKPAETSATVHTLPTLPGQADRPVPAAFVSSTSPIFTGACAVT